MRELIEEIDNNQGVKTQNVNGVGPEIVKNSGEVGKRRY